MIISQIEKYLTVLCIIAGCLFSPAASSMFGRASNTDHHETAARRIAVDRYIREPGDSTSHDRKLKLAQTNPPKPVFVSDAARVNYRGRAELPVIDQKQHELHYITAATDAAMNVAVSRDVPKPAPINILLLALEIVFLKPEVDKFPTLQRETFPVLYDRSTNNLVLGTSPPDAGRPYCFFLSYNRKNTRAKNTHKHIIGLSREAPFPVSFREEHMAVHFHPSIVGQEGEKMSLMESHFPGMKQPFHSEANAVYWLMKTPSLVEELLGSLPMNSEVLSFGVRYFSFLDMCEGCQEFLEGSQGVLRRIFLDSLTTYISKKKLKRVRDDIPFLTFAHGNRVYRGNTYESSGEKHRPKKEEGPYLYATSGPDEGSFVREFIRFGGVLEPKRDTINRLIEVVHEADLGEDHELGKTRKYFSETTEVTFPRQGLRDEELHVLNSKAERANPLEITHFDISKNKFGWENPEFGDDPIPLTNGKMIASTVRFIGSCVNLKSLFLGSCVWRSVVPELMSNLPYLRKLKILHLNAIGVSIFPSNDMASLLPILSPLQCLEILNISDNHLFYEGVDELASLVAQLPALKELHMRRISPFPMWDGQTHPSDVIPALRQGYIDDKTAFLSLAKAIRDAPQLAFVDIEGNCSGSNQMAIQSQFLEIIGRDVSHRAFPIDSADSNNE